jgi:Arc/MetJ-type ribon-helix-helix transcriptional regulator
MTIPLSKPEIEALIQKRLASGAFENIDDVIYRALESRGAEESWLLLHQREVAEKLDWVMEEFAQGDGIPASKVRQHLTGDEGGSTYEKCGVSPRHG